MAYTQQRVLLGTYGKRSLWMKIESIIKRRKGGYVQIPVTKTYVDDWYNGY